MISCFEASWQASSSTMQFPAMLTPMSVGDLYGQCSYMAIEGITSPDGRVLGKMAHSERRGDGVAINIYGEQDLKIFESGVAFFRD